MTRLRLSQWATQLLDAEVQAKPSADERLYLSLQLAGHADMARDKVWPSPPLCALALSLV